MALCGSAHCRLIGYFHLNVQSIFPLSKPAGIFHSCPRGSLSTFSCLEQKSHQGSPQGGNFKAEGLPRGGCRPLLLIQTGCPPPESPARTCVVCTLPAGSPIPRALPQAHPLTWVSGSASLFLGLNVPSHPLRPWESYPSSTDKGPT